jgi:glycosyltransferase involved in cell wall biosynthesis
MNNLKVLHLIPSLAVGGMERLVCDLVTARDKTTTSIVCLNTLGLLGEQISHQVDVKVLHLSGNILNGIVNVYKELKKQKPQIVHCHNLQAHFYGSICAKLLGNMKVVLTKHGQHIPQTGLTTKINRITLKSSKTIGVSADITKLMNGWIYDGRYTAEYIANGAPLRSEKTLNDEKITKHSLGIQDDCICLGIVARLSKPKDHTVLVKSIKELSHSYPNIHLLIIGDGPLKSDIAALIDNLNASTQITLLGERQDIPDILHLLDIFVLTSSSEGIPMTILEAMAARLPVVATNIGGIPQVVIDGETGFLVADKQQKELSEALARLIDDPNLRARFGGNGRTLLEKNYSIKQTMEKYEVIYTNLINPGMSVDI